jgi:8-oxo-dGTP diphosphatase
VKIACGEIYKMTSTPQVILKNRYQVVARTILYIFRDGTVLLQKGSPTKKINAGLWNGLGGHIERGEDVLSAARRELLEEAGISCNNLQLNGTVIIDVNKTEGILLFVFSGDDIIGEINPSEEGILAWFDLGNLPSNEIVDDVPELISHIYEAISRQKQFYLLYTYDKNGNRITTTS